MAFAVVAVAGAERSSAVLMHDNWPNAELAVCASPPRPFRRRAALHHGGLVKLGAVADGRARRAK